MNHHTGQIDGPGMTVEIDESKFGKLKFNRGRCIEGQWVFGGICRQTKACFLVPVGQRDKDTLLPIIRAHISPGTCVLSDMWNAYDCIKDEGYTHLTVNHSLNFGVYLGVKTCEVFLCFVAIVRVRAIVLTSLFSLFYVTGECHRFLHRG